jgi:hypothetical protein
MKHNTLRQIIKDKKLPYLIELDYFRLRNSIIDCASVFRERAYIMLRIFKNYKKVKGKMAREDK